VDLHVNEGFLPQGDPAELEQVGDLTVEFSTVDGGTL